MKTKNSKVILILSTLILFQYFSCTDSNKQKVNRSRVIVLCDASNSVIATGLKNANESRLINLKNYIQKIPKWYPFESEIYYFPISDNLLSDRIGKMISYKVKKSSQLEPEKERNDSLLNDIVNKIDVLASNTINSCILLSIQRAINRFYEFPPDSNRNNELIIISDMLECCKSFNGKEINMGVYNETQLSQVITQFEKENPEFNASKLNLKIKVIINSPGNDEKYTSIKNAWLNWFYKIGIKKGDIIFYTDEPNLETNKLLN